MKMESAQIEFASYQIGLIDSGEKAIFLETVNTDKQINSNVFHNDNISGVYFSCVIFDGVRIHISFNMDTDMFNEDITALIYSTLQKSGFSSCLIWVWNKNRKIIDFLKDKFHIEPDCGIYYYASIEFIMRRKNFKKTSRNNPLDIRSYEERHLEKYLNLLDGSMSFASPPPNFMANKENYAKRFSEQCTDNSFEAFWKDGELVGLYWRKNAEIDIMAVSVNQQRKGYGSTILTRAIEMVFANTTDDYAYLYAVDWNLKGQQFYNKYGMEQNGHSYLLHLNNFSV